MTSYAFRRGCSNVLLLYPNQSDEIKQDDRFHISSGLYNKLKIAVVVAEIPFWSSGGHQNIDRLLFITLKSLLGNFAGTQTADA